MKTKRQTKKISVISSVIALLLIAIGMLFYKKNDENKASIPESVQVVATVPASLLKIKVHPEKRVPAVGNWGTDLQVVFAPTGTNNLSTIVNGTSDASGEAVINIYDQGVTNATTGDYDFYVKGLSHLRRLFPNINAFHYAQTEIDLSDDGNLYAGETSNIFDNYINSLDISTQITTLFTNSNKNDLNQDGLVNSLDLSNTITNFFKTGD